MLRFYAVSYVNITTILGYMERHFRNEAQNPLTEEKKNKMRGTLEYMGIELDKIGLKQSRKKVNRMIESTKDELVGRDVFQAVEDLRDRIRDELEDGYFLHLTDGEADLIEDKEPFGAEVTAKIGAQADIQEAAKCLGFGRTTACVFHLMRLMELSLQKFGAKLGITLIDSRGKDKMWQNILNEVDAAIKAMDQKAPETKHYASLSALLYNVKLAWRNEVMHPKDTYTEEEAKKLFNTVRDFICDLSSVL